MDFIPKMLIEPDPWLAGILGRPAYRIQMGSDWTERMHQCTPSIRELQANPGFMFAKVSTSDLKAAEFLEDLGFHLVDTLVTLEKPISRKQNVAHHSVVRWAEPQDEETVAQLARINLTTSRFHLDPSIAKETADCIKEEWARNYFRRQRGDQMVVALVHNRAGGFLQLLHGRGGVLIIDLIATDEAERRKGIASSMIAFAETQTSAFSKIRTGTQISNIPSLAFYEKLGFRICSTEYVFHFHKISSS